MPTAATSLATVPLSQLLEELDRRLHGSSSASKTAAAAKAATPPRPKSERRSVPSSSPAPQKATASVPAGTTDATWTPEAIRALRASLKMTQVQFAKALGVNAVSVYGYETRDAKGKPRQRPTRTGVLARLEKLKTRAGKKGKTK